MSPPTQPPPATTPSARTTPGPLETVTPSAATGLPTPVAAWGLRGDGEASVGSVDLEFEGGFTLTPGGVAFDGVTGKAVTVGPCPLDTTRSMTLSAWVTHPDRLGDLPFVLSLTHDGERAEAVRSGA